MTTVIRPRRSELTVTAGTRDRLRLLSYGRNTGQTVTSVILSRHETDCDYCHMAKTRDRLSTVGTRDKNATTVIRPRYETDCGYCHTAKTRDKLRLLSYGRDTGQTDCCYKAGTRYRLGLLSYCRDTGQTVTTVIRPGHGINCDYCHKVGTRDKLAAVIRPRHGKDCDYCHKTGTRDKLDTMHRVK